MPEYIAEYVFNMALNTHGNMYINNLIVIEMPARGMFI